MYSRRNIALVFHDYTDEKTVIWGIDSVPDYVDRIYVLGMNEGSDVHPPAWDDLPVRRPDLIVNGNYSVTATRAYSPSVSINRSKRSASR